MARPRAADDFAAIRARIEELRRERVQAARGHDDEPPEKHVRNARSRNVEADLKPYLRPARNPLER